MSCQKNYVLVISFTMFYENMNVLMYNVIGAVIYNIIDEYIRLDYLSLLQDNLSKHNNDFKNTKLKNLSWLGIRDILINIMSGHGFLKRS